MLHFYDTENHIGNKVCFSYRTIAEKPQVGVMCSTFAIQTIISVTKFVFRTAQ